MMQGNEPQIIRRDNAYSVKKQFGDIYDCIVTNVLNDGRIYVHVPDLGSDLGPILPLSTDITNKYSVNDTVVGTFMTSAMTSFVIFGSSKSKKRSSILIFSTEQERTDSLGAVPTSSFFTYVIETGYLQLWNGTTWTQFLGPPGPAGDWSLPQEINTQTGTSYTVLNSDKGKIVTLNNSSGQTVTINTATALTTGQKIDFLNLGAGIVVFSGSGVTLNATPGLRFRARYSAATLVCISTDNYVLMGDLIL